MVTNGPVPFGYLPQVTSVVCAPKTERILTATGIRRVTVVFVRPVISRVIDNNDHFSLGMFHVRRYNLLNQAVSGKCGNTFKNTEPIYREMINITREKHYGMNEKYKGVPLSRTFLDYISRNVEFCSSERKDFLNDHMDKSIQKPILKGTYREEEYINNKSFVGLDHMSQR